MTKIYTRTGDDGTTSLVGGKRVSKTDLRLEAYGTIDELNSYLGLLLSVMDEQESESANIRWIQQKLFSIGGCLATDFTESVLAESCRITMAHVEHLERMTDGVQIGLPQQRSFILPGGTQAASFAHVARTVCRRAERIIIAVSETNQLPSELLCFVNRLSDYLFVLARHLNFTRGVAEKNW